MRIAQIVLADASDYDRKSQRIDRDALAGSHEVIETTFEDAAATGAELVHVYAGEGFVPPRRGRFRLRWVSSTTPGPPYFRWPRRSEPLAILSPLDNLPEAVEERFFASPPAQVPRSARDDNKRVGVFGKHREGVANMVEQAGARIARFRDDVEWLFFDAPPSPADLSGVDAWCDPAVNEKDFDGFTAEAIVAGKVVVASRTPINERRLERGRSGLLVPPRDSNELTHAILAALFKLEVAELKIEAARQTAGKFRPRHRLRVLEKLYATLSA